MLLLVEQQSTCVFEGRRYLILAMVAECCSAVRVDGWFLPSLLRAASFGCPAMVGER